MGRFTTSVATVVLDLLLFGEILKTAEDQTILKTTANKMLIYRNDISVSLHHMIVIMKSLYFKEFIIRNY